jgi:hypothetical protein
MVSIGKRTRVKRPVHITEDESDILISMRREKERRVSLAEVLRNHGIEPRGGTPIGIK